MRFFQNLPMRFKLMMIYSTVFILSVCLSGGVIYFFVQQTIKTNIENELQNTTTSILNMVNTTARASVRNSHWRSR